MTARSILCFSIVAGLAALVSSDAFAQGYYGNRGPVRWSGKFLGAGWGSGNHWENSGVDPSYYNPYSAHNSNLVSRSPEYLARFGNQGDRLDYLWGANYGYHNEIGINGYQNEFGANGSMLHQPEIRNDSIPFDRYSPTNSESVPLDQLPGEEIDSRAETKEMNEYDPKPNQGNGEFKPTGESSSDSGSDRWWEENK